MKTVLALCAFACIAAAAPVDPYAPEANSAPFEQTAEAPTPAPVPAPAPAPPETAPAPVPETPAAETATPAPAVDAPNATPPDMARILKAVGTEMDKSASSATSDAQAPAPETVKPKGWTSLLQGTYALLIVLALIFVAYVILMRIRRHAPMLGGGPFASVVGRLHLDTRFALHFVRVGDKVLLLGVTAQNINILEAFDAATFNLDHAQAAPEVESQHDFMAHLRASTQALNPLTPAASDDEEIVSLRGDIERLKRYLEEGPRVDPEH